jgi:hypothetical protein
LLGIDTDPDLPDPDRHALEADTGTDLYPAKWCGSDLTGRIRIHNTVFVNILLHR